MTALRQLPWAPVSRLCCAAAVALAVSTAMPATQALAEGWPSQVDATYRIHFNSFEIGTFGFRANFAGASYVTEGHAQISALLGFVKWEGHSRSSGNLGGQGAQPAAYTFDFSGGGKSGSMKMGFMNGQVTSVASVPVKPLPADTVPVEVQHLKGVLDPLTTVLAMSRPQNGNACGRKLAIFDGRQRLDLVLSPLRQQQIPEARPSGQPTLATVCRVRYVPVAGHRKAEEGEHMATTDGIEVVFRPVPSAGLFVPHQITIPLPAGSITLTAERVDIQTRQEQIALVN